MFSFSIKSQVDETQPYMFWHSVGLSTDMGEKMKFKLSILNSLSFSTGKYNFIQPKIAFSIDAGKRSDIDFGFKPIYSITNQSFNSRVFVTYAHRSKKNKFRFKNSLTAEFNFRQYSKFRERFYYAFNTYYRNTKWPLRIRPYGTLKLYYYLNGNDLQYYDDKGEPTKVASPNGLHAFRYILGFKIYPSKKASMNFYYQGQKEFNTGTKFSNNINDLNPNSGSIRRDFYDFGVLGFSLFFSL